MAKRDTSDSEPRGNGETDTAVLTVDTNQVPAATQAQPLCVVPLGRGTRGKTWWVRWAVGRALAQGRDIVIADADRTNATLSAFFDRVVTPPSADETDMRDWFAAFIERQIADRFTDERMISRLTLLFAALALLLASFGLYGVTAYTVVRRTSEIGIRMALGAQRSSVVAMIMRRAMLQTLLGLAIGVPVALVCVRLIKSELYDITHADVPVLAGAIVALAASALIAGFIPGRRAASINPAQALRSE